MMKPSVWTDYYEILSPEEAILGLKEAGFSYGEFSIDHSRMLQARGGDVEKIGLRFRAFMDEVGFSTLQGHLDFERPLTAPETDPLGGRLPAEGRKTGRRRGCA